MFVPFGGYRPRVSPGAFVAPTAVLIGNVAVEEGASIWYGAVLRADHGEQGIVVGPRSSIQDNCVLHVSERHRTAVGAGVTVGHGAILEGCTVEDGALIGMNAVVLEGAVVGTRSLIAAGSTVLAGVTIPPDSLAAGAPARVRKAIEGESRRWIEESAQYYVDLAERYRAQGLGEMIDT